jgi:alkaline phosphatase D
MSVSRRNFLRGTAAAGAGLALPGLAACVPEGSATVPPYRYGVASGDPDTTSVVLWTHHEPLALSTAPIDLTWEVATDAAFANIIGFGTTTAQAARDYTVKVIAGGLAPGTTYYYRFTSSAGRSPVGRTRTAPSGSVARLRFGFAACSNYAEGYFHSYRHLAARNDLDAVVHLGDYIYEYGGTSTRSVDPQAEAVTLADYRRRYAWHRADADLRELHRQHPMICIWDDHEFANDPYVGGAQNHQPATEGSWSTRVAAALQAHAEWMPTRVENDLAYRALRYGPLATLVVVDRQRRNIAPQADDGTLYLGKAQFDWLDTTLTGSSAKWLVLATQSPFASITAAMTGEGYGDRDRARVLDKFVAGPAGNLVVASGDFHKFRALDVPRTPANYNATTGAGSTAVEVTVGSITSAGVTDAVVGPQVRYSAGDVRGYALMTLTPTAMQTDFYGFDDALKRSSSLPAERWLAGFRSLDGSARLTRATSPA